MIRQAALSIPVDDQISSAMDDTPQSSKQAEKDYKEIENGYCVDPDLISLLDCPVCHEPMFAPIEQCSEGHSLCGGCRKGVTSCPVCRGPLQGTRNRLAEDIAERLLGRRCENGDLGCPARLPAPRLLRHQFSCEFRACKCIFCRDSFPSKELVAHCRNNHEAVIDGPTARGIIDADCLRKEQFYGSLVEAHDELFWFWWFASDCVVYMGVDHCAKTESAFSYFLELKSFETRQQMVFSGPLHSADDHGAAEVLEPCAKCNCATVKLLEIGTTFNVIISKEDDNVEKENGRKDEECSLLSSGSCGYAL